MSGEKTPGSPGRKKRVPFGKRHPNWKQLSDEELEEQYSPSPLDWKLITLARNLDREIQVQMQRGRITPPTYKRFSEMVGVDLPVIMDMIRAKRWVDSETIARLEIAMSRPVWAREPSRPYKDAPTFWREYEHKRLLERDRKRYEDYINRFRQ